MLLASIGEPQPRRRRRQLRLVAIVIGVIVVALVVWRACTAGPSATADYVDRVRPIIQDSNELSLAMKSISSELTTFTRDVLDERLSSLEGEAATLVDEAVKLQAKEGARDLQALVVGALKLRAAGVKNFRRGVSNALEGVPAQQVTAELQNAMDLIGAGDRSYALFQEEARARLQQSKESKVEVPDSQYLRDSPYSADGLPKFVKALQSQPRLAPIHDVVIAQITTRPGSTGKLGDIDLIPASSSFTVVVTVSNDGNLPERDLVVKIRLTSETRPEPQEQEQRIPALEPGGKRSLSFTGLDPTKNQTKNTVTAFVDPVTDEKNVDNNRRDYSFAVRG
jgi:hypothetical protein